MINRRIALTGAAAAGALALCSPSRAADIGGRRFEIFRGKGVIGAQSINVRREDAYTVARTQIDIAVTFLGITAYRYTLSCTERWTAGRLVSLTSDCDDDGDQTYVRVNAVEGGLLVDASGHQGVIAADAAPTTYWSSDFLTRPTWISTQTGIPLAITCTEAGSETVSAGAGPREAQRWNVTGDLEMTLLFAGGEWAGNIFDAKGETGRLSATSLTPALSPLLGPA
jgi:hypothetical protein